MTLTLLSFVLAVLVPPSKATLVREGSSPQLAVDTRGTIRMIFGRKDTIFAVTSRDGGATFGPPSIVGVVTDMHLGNTRGPTIASSRNRSVVLAVDKTGNISTFQLDHATDRWKRLDGTLNDSAGSAPEGLASVAADDADNFYSVWLDLREGRQNQIYFAKVPLNGATRSPNRRLYASPDGHVCECCRPSIAISGRGVAVMFRNWVDSARDMYLTTSTNGGQEFATAQKLGAGTWKLDACPMDGGGLVIDSKGAIGTVWRRDATIYYARPGEAEVRIADGRSPMIARSAKSAHLVWQEGSTIKLRSMSDGGETVVGEGRLPQVLSLRDGRALIAWEKDGKVFYQKF